MRRCLALALAGLFCFAQGSQGGHITLLGAGKQGAGGGGGGGTWTLVANTTTAGTASGTSSAVNASGAKLFVATIGCYTNSGAANCNAVSDSSSNTWTRIATGDTVNSFQINMFYVISPTTTASHTFSFACGGTGNCFAAMEVQAWTESGTPVFDQNSFNHSLTTSTTTGSITPTGNNSLIVSGAMYDGASGSAFSVDSGLTITNQQQLASGVSEGGAMGYLQQTTAAAINPTWSASTASTFIAGIANFKP